MTIPVNSNGEWIVEGCNYHTTWQSHRAMRFVLDAVNGDKAKLSTRQTQREFWTSLDSLIFINSPHNVDKAKRFMRKREKHHDQPRN